MPHLFIDISAHGFGHLAQTGPALDALAERCPDLQLTIRSGLPLAQLQQRIAHPFRYIAGASDVAFLMHDATRIDREASAEAYRKAHADWPGRVAAEAAFLAGLAPDAVLANISCLPLAGARRLGLPAVAMCSLNWADQFASLFSGEAWAVPIHAELQAAYAGATTFLRCTPAMPMAELPNTRSLPPVARLGTRCRETLEAAIGAAGERLVLVAMGGIGFRLPVAQWPQTPGVRWLVGEALLVPRPDVTPYRQLDLHFSDLLASVDAIVTKPGYGTFVESAAAGIPLLYVRREDWPEQDVLIDWLAKVTVCAEVPADDFAAGSFVPLLEELWQRAVQPVAANGAAVAADYLLELLSGTLRAGS